MSVSTKAREDAAPETPETDYDVVVVGSGFGGSVAALRLAEKGYKVHVYESGKRYEDKDFAKTSWRARKFMWIPALGLYGIQRIHRMKHVTVLAGAGVGGGSLVYANTLYVPPRPFFEDRQWGHITDWQSELTPYYDQAKRMLGVVEQNPCEGMAERVMKSTAERLGVGDTFRKTPVGVFFGRDGEREPDVVVPDPYFGGVGPSRTGCNDCGHCMTGCRVGAKNTLMKNYIALAERLGVNFEPLRHVTDVQPVDPEDLSQGYRITSQRTGAWLRTQTKTVTAKQIVVAAGAWGTQNLMHRLKAQGSLPHLSPSLGSMVRTNSEALIGVSGSRRPKTGDKEALAKGVAITTSFHPDSDTHIENCRYGPGSNAMGMLATVLVDGGPSGGKRTLGGFLKMVARHPWFFLRTFSMWQGSERTIIALVMQSRDNSLTTSVRKRLLGRGYSMKTSFGHGEPNPYWIESGHNAVKVMAEELSKETGSSTLAGGSWVDVINNPITAHFLGGCPISDDPNKGVIDAYHRVFGYPNISVVDGAAISANLGVNPSLTITAQAERAFSLWPNKGDADQRPAMGADYERLTPIEPQNPVVPAHAPGALRLLPLSVK